VSSRDDAREKGVPRRYKECLSMFILLSDTCIKKINRRLPRGITSRYFFQKYRLFLYLYVGGVNPPPFVYTFEVHVLVEVRIILVTKHRLPVPVQVHLTSLRRFSSQAGRRAGRTERVKDRINHKSRVKAVMSHES
jgi:hypothetical protein